MTRYGSRRLVHRWRSVRSTAAFEAHAKAFKRAIPPHLFRGAGATAYAERAPRQAREIKRLLGHATHDIAEQHYIYAQAINASRRHVAMMEELRSQAMDEEGYSFQHRPEKSQLSSSMACDICLVIAPEPDPA